MKKVKSLQYQDKSIDSFLRPTSWQEYIGQEKIKKNLNLIITAAKKRNEPIDHLLLCGPTGLGKTTLAALIAKELGANLKITTGPSLQKAGELAAVLSNLGNFDILFIDEIHRLNRSIEEILYPAMESRKLHLVIGKGLGSRMVSLDIAPFALIAATTRPNLLSNPLRSRFGASFQFEYYNLEEIKAIIERSADLLKIKIKPSAMSIIASASRCTPRTANRLLKRCRDFAEVRNFKLIEEEVVCETLKFLEIDELGLESYERKLLETIIKKFNNRPIGVNVLTAVLGEEKGIIEEIYEPYLVKIGLLQRTPHGRIATEAAFKHLKI
ncbi:MAG: Holliday junction branch migration DNA helicase RuvB [Flavobacterium sp.]|nr:Holliday junction branch migration DNA helicase RuvB [Flavobacterium sp.]